MTIESPSESALETGGAGRGKGEPSLEWSDGDLYAFLAHAWGQDGAAHIKVIGRLRATTGTYGFLEDLHHPVTGAPLPPPSGGSRAHQKVFVPPSERELLNRYRGSALAELQLSPLKERQKHVDPFACMVRQGTLEPLSVVPESWMKGRKDAGGPLILASVREAVEEQLSRETADAKARLLEARSALEEVSKETADAEARLLEARSALEAAVLKKQSQLREKTADAEAKLLEARSALKAAVREKQSQLREETADAEAKLVEARSALVALDGERGRLDREIGERTERVAELDAEYQQRRDTLEDRYQELVALLRERGERLVALELLDRTDLEKVLPPAGRADARVGHRFQEVLGGDFRQLAAYVQAHLWREGIHYTRAQLLDFITLLRTGDLIVLAGDSGSGKTSLVKSVASAIGGRCTIVPVKPNWTSSDDLLGYYNPIEQRYHPSAFLRALLEAAREPDVPHFICLDEMNLARVEYYFADFLSLLETRTKPPRIDLYTAAEERQAVVDNRIFLDLAEEARKRANLPTDASLGDMLRHDQASLELRRLAGRPEADALLDHHAKLRRSIAGLIEIPTGFPFPSNAWIIGAINVDETTHYLSPKVLDRAHVMRFRNPVLIEWGKVERELEKFEFDVSLPMNLLAKEIGVRAEYPAFNHADPQVNLLVGLARDHLDPLGIEFGMRAIRQSLNYLQKAKEAEIGTSAALNNVALHKILPKITLDLEKTATDGKKRRDVLIGLRDALAKVLKGFDEAQVTESAVGCLDALIARSEGNNGIANFWAR